MCGQRRTRSDCASAQSDLGLCRPLGKSVGTVEFTNSGQRPWWRRADAQGNRKLRISHTRRNVKKRTFGYVPRGDSDQSVHLHSLKWILTWRNLDSQGCKVFHANNEESDRSVWMLIWVSVIVSYVFTCIGSYIFEYMFSLDVTYIVLWLQYKSFPISYYWV